MASKEFILGAEFCIIFDHLINCMINKRIPLLETNEECCLKAETGSPPSLRGEGTRIVTYDEFNLRRSFTRSFLRSLLRCTAAQFMACRDIFSAAIHSDCDGRTEGGTIIHSGLGRQRISKRFEGNCTSLLQSSSYQMASGFGTSCKQKWIFTLRFTMTQ